MKYPKSIKLCVKVNARDIRIGTTRNCQFCPIARALRRAYLLLFPLAKRNNKACAVPTVGRCLMIQRFVEPSSKPVHKYCALTPPNAQVFIRDFDHDGSGKPFQFTVTLFKHA